MHLIRTTDDRWINPDVVAEWRELDVDAHERDRYALLDREGNKLGDTFDYPWQCAAATVAAQPGFKLLRYWRDDADGGVVGEQLVIAWQVGGAFPLPVTVTELQVDIDDDFAIELPDGRVAMPEQEYANRAQWKEVAAQRHKKRYGAALTQRGTAAKKNAAPTTNAPAASLASTKEQQ